jgi:DNA-binding MarR family transcriptional regulator
MFESGPVVNALQNWMELFMRRSMRNFIFFCKENNISLSQMNTLFHLQHKGTCGVSEVGEHLGVTNAAASQILDRLVQQTLVARSEDPNDRRVKQIEITKKGQHLLEEGIRARQNWWADLESRLSPEEQEQVVAALNVLIEKTAELSELLPEGNS